jgi:hypothetical protein
MQAVTSRKSIVVLRDSKHNIAESDIPAEWKYFQALLTGPRTIMYSSDLQCAEILKDIRTNPHKNSTKYYKSSDTGIKYTACVINVRVLSSSGR